MNTRRFLFIPLGIAAIFAVTPVARLSAFSSGSGTYAKPYVLTDTDVLLDGGATYYSVGDALFIDALTVGKTTTGNHLALSVSGADLYDNTAIVGDSAGSSGDVTLTNSALWDCLGSLTIGNSGTGVVNVSGAGTALQAPTLTVGSTGTGTVSLTDGASMTSSTFHLAGNAGSSGTATISGAGTLCLIGSELTVGTSGTGDLTISDGATVEKSSTGSTYIGVGYASGSTGRMVVTGSGTKVASFYQVYVGDSGKGTLVVSDGARFSNDVTIIGMDSTGVGLAVLVDSGSFWAITTAMSMNGDGWASLVISNGALMRIDASDGLGTTNGTLYLADGYLALKGSHTASEIATSHSIRVCTGTGWAVATTGNLTATYYDGTTNVWSASARYSVYGGDLTGYTVITGGNPKMTWSDAKVEGEGWYNSSWYGMYYNALTWAGWIWHPSHGWQYVYPVGGEAEILWDVATQEWWYVDGAYYPAMYSYATDKWFYFEGGVTPARTFWDYTAKTSVTENVGM